VKHGDLGSTPEAIIYLPATQTPASTMTVVVRTEADPLRIVNMVRLVVARLDKDLPLFEVKTLDEYLTLSLAQTRFISVLTSVFATMATVISAAGLYGVISYLVTQRTREIGIRMALGAESGNVLLMVVGQSLRFIVTGVVIGLTASVTLAGVLSSLLFGVTARDPVSLSVASLLLTAVSLLACYIPARRAAKIDPIVALRHE
jgi:putative ABC transport system permease protein